PRDNVAAGCENKVIGPAVLVTMPRVATLAGSSVAVRLTCQALAIGGCQGSLALQLALPPAKTPAKPKQRASARAAAHAKKKRKAKPKRKSKPKRKPKPRLVPFGSPVSYSLSPGQTTVVTVTP